MSSPSLQFILFDLDDTLYPRDAGLMDRIHELMEDWMINHLGIDRQEALALRRRLYQQYGTSMAGLLAEHHIDPNDFLHYVHNFDPGAFLQPDPALSQALKRIPLHRIVFTNATKAHAWRVLEALGVRSLFERIIDVVDVGYVSKPARLAYQQALALLNAAAWECILVEDSLRNLAPAKEMGMITILVGNEPHEAADYWVPEVVQVADVVDLMMRTTRESPA